MKTKQVTTMKTETEILTQTCQSIVKLLDGLPLDTVMSVLANVEYQIGQHGVMSFKNIDDIQFNEDLKPRR